MAFKVSLKLSVDTLQLLDDLCGLMGKNHDAVIGKALEGLDLTIDEEVITFENPEHIGSDLRFTKLESAEIDGVKIESPGWGELVVKALVLASNKMDTKDPKKLKEISGAYIMDEIAYAEHEAKAEREGKTIAYKKAPPFDFYIKRAEASRSWKQALSIAKHLNVPISVAFRWRSFTTTEGNYLASHPGRKGKLEWAPTTASSEHTYSP